MKRSEIKRRPIADTVLKALEPEKMEYREKYNDDRLYFTVNPSGRRRWDLRYKKPGSSEWSWLGLGSYPAVSAKKAKEKADQVITLLEQGIDPRAAKAAERAAKKGPVLNPFRETAEAWYQKKKKDGRAEKTLKSYRYCLDNDILPAIGDKSISQVTRGDCAAIQESIESRRAHNTAEKARTWLNEIFGIAIARGLTENNPASNLKDIAVAAPKEQQYPHLLEPKLPQFLRAVAEGPSRLKTQVASWMVLRTASRPGMVRFAEWDQFDFDKGIWDVPARIMKGEERDHLVPLPSQVIRDLKELRRLTGRSKYLFPSDGPTGVVMSENTINKGFSRVGYKGAMTGHGSRHTCKTLLSEHGWPENWSEAQLAHKKPGLKGVYDKAAYIEPRKKMMQWYNDYLDKLRTGMSAEEREKFRLRVIEVKSEYAALYREQSY